MPYKKVKKTKTTATVIKVAVIQKTTTIVETQPLTHKQKAKKFLKHLRKHFGVFQKYQPLMVGVAKELYPVFTETPHRVINTALHLHTHSKRYLRNVSKHKNRVNLCGQFVAKTDAISAQKAKQELNALFKIDCV